MLDGNHIWVTRGLPQELHHHVEAFVWVMNNDILGANGSEAIAAEIQDAFGEARRIGREQKIRPVIHNQLRQIRKPKQPIHHKNFRSRRIQFLGNEIKNIGRRIGGDRKPDSAPTAAALQRAFIGTHQIFGFFFEFHIGVADQAEQTAFGHNEAGKEATQKQKNHIFQQHKAHRPRATARWQADEALHLGRQRQKGAHGAAIFFAHQFENQAQRQVGDEGKGMRGVHG